MSVSEEDYNILYKNYKILLKITDKLRKSFQKYKDFQKLDEKERDYKIYAEKWTDIDTEYNNKHPEWVYIRPYIKMMMKIDGRHPAFLKALKDARKARHEYVNVPTKATSINKNPVIAKSDTNPDSIITQTVSNNISIQTDHLNKQNKSSQTYGARKRHVSIQKKPRVKNISVQTAISLIHLTDEIRYIKEENFEAPVKTANAQQSTQQSNDLNKNNVTTPKIQTMTTKSIEKNSLSAKRPSSNIQSPPVMNKIPSLLNVKVNAPSNVRFETLQWLQRDCRLGCWNCHDIGHDFEKCKHLKLRTFCFGCGLENFKIHQCPNCKESHKKRRQS